MPIWIPALITLAAKVAGIIGVVKGAIGVGRIAYAKKLVDQANTITRTAQDRLESQRETTNYALARIIHVERHQPTPCYFLLD